MVERIAVAPELLGWARNRAGLTVGDLAQRFPRLVQWEAGDLHPTMLQLEDFARATHAPLGMLFLPEPPLPEELPVPDMRTLGDERLREPSPDLLDTINLCRRRQNWFQDYARGAGYERIDFVGSMTTSRDPESAAGEIREALGFTMNARAAHSTWTDSLRGLSDHAEGIGVLVMISGVVGSNTSRILDPHEFRGFALADDYAPLVFINGTDTKAAQIFTLAHELAHLWLGRSGVDLPDLGARTVDAPPDRAQDGRIERWCNAVAAELLVPLDVLRRQYTPAVAADAQLAGLARLFKVSTLVVLRRLFDLRAFDWDDFRDLYDAELTRVLEQAANRTPGGNYYNTEPVRLSKRFARALIADTLRGGTSFHEAFQLTGSRKRATFDKLSAGLGIN